MSDTPDTTFWHGLYEKRRATGGDEVYTTTDVLNLEPANGLLVEKQTREATALREAAAKGMHIDPVDALLEKAVAEAANEVRMGLVMHSQDHAFSDRIPGLQDQNLDTDAVFPADTAMTVDAAGKKVTIASAEKDVTADGEFKDDAVEGIVIAAVGAARKLKHELPSRVAYNDYDLSMTVRRVSYNQPRKPVDGEPEGKLVFQRVETTLRFFAVRIYLIVGNSSVQIGGAGLTPEDAALDATKRYVAHENNLRKAPQPASVPPPPVEAQPVKALVQASPPAATEGEAGEKQE